MKLISILLLGSLLCVISIAQADPRAWGDTGMPIRQGFHLKWNQGMTRDANGNTLLVWTEQSTGQRDVRAQLINSAGEEQWLSGGVIVTPESHSQNNPVATAVNGGWIIAWADYRAIANCENFWDYFCGAVFAQKLDYSGNRVWADNDFTGVEIYQPETQGIEQSSLNIVPDGSGGAMIAWSFIGDVLAQRVTANGNVAWDEAVQISGNEPQYWLEPTSAPGADGSMIVAWHEGENVHLSRILPDGSLSWGQDGITVSDTATGVNEVRIAPDGSNGCYVGWADHHSGSSQLYIQHVTSDGQPLWPANGIAISAIYNWNFDLALSWYSGVADGVLAVWMHYEQPNQYFVYAQKISPEGTVAWQDGGLSLAEVNANAWQGYPTVTTDYNGGLVAVWQDRPQGIPSYFACRLRSNGTMAWGTDPVSLGAASWDQAAAIGGNFGTYLAAYAGVDTLGVESMQYQLLDHASGSRLLGPNGMAAAAGIRGDSYLAQMAPMSDHRTAIIWLDGRLSNSWLGALYYQIVDADGHPERAVNGEPLVSNRYGNNIGWWGIRTGDDGAGGIFVSYNYRQDGSAQLIRVSHIGPSGDVVGPDSGMAVWSYPGLVEQDAAYIAPDGENGCFVAWSEYSEVYTLDVYVMRLNSNLDRVWNQPVRLTETATDDLMYGLVSVADNCCIAVWQSGDYEEYDISAAAICGDGTVAWNDTICGAFGNQSAPVAVSDGDGGIYIAWTDMRDANENGSDIYAQRVATDGAPSWTSDGIPVYAGEGGQWNPQITLDSGGKLCVVWNDRRDDNDHVYAQRLSPQGNLLWGDSGVLVNNAYVYDPLPVAASSRAGIFPVWADYQGYFSSVFATHLDSTGEVFNDPYWTPDSGGAVTDPAFDREFSDSPLVTSDSWGGCVVGWNRWESEYIIESGREAWEAYTTDIYAQRLFDYTNPVPERDNKLPRDYALYQNYPNPFNPVTTIAFDLPQAGHATLEVFDLLGRSVVTLADQPMIAGHHTIVLDAGKLATGIYIYRLKVGSLEQSRKLLLLK